MPMRYQVNFGNWLNSVLSSVFKEDGSVQITIGSIDMGQGSQVGNKITFILSYSKLTPYFPADKGSSWQNLYERLQYFYR